MAEQIEKAIGKYVDAARTGDPDLMRDAFLTGATVRGSYGGKPADWTLQEFCDLIAKGGPAPDLEARIAVVEVSGTAAMARLEAVNWRGTRYTDFFLLLRRDGEWRIASKVFFAHDRA
jgi:hypothetical protein